MTAPLLSFVVQSYNYEDYIPITLRSILVQTVQDFEIIVVDDGSSDRSVEAIRAFDDPRIRLLIHDTNQGAALAYEWALREARGQWIVNLDADDWIAPEKSARQLAFAEREGVDVVGTWVNFVDADGKRHQRALELEEITNRPHRFNEVDAWIGHNHLCRSSTMVRRHAFDRVGLPDRSMVRAPDYEHWNRMVGAGLRFGLLEEPLTFYRLQPRGVTHGDPRATFLEMSWSAIRNLLPTIETRSLWPSYRRLCCWLARNESLALLTARERERLMGMVLLPPSCDDYQGFLNALATHDPIREGLGRRLFSISRTVEEEAAQLIARQQSDIRAYIAARDWWKSESERYLRWLPWLAVYRALRRSPASQFLRSSRSWRKER
jgi:glycosyltransferase involved in cell wall biosynthesis